MATNKTKGRPLKPTARVPKGRPKPPIDRPINRSWFKSKLQQTADQAGTAPQPAQTPTAPRAAVRPLLLPTQQADVRKTSLRVNPSPMKPLEPEGTRTCDGRGSKTLLTPDKEPRVAAVGNRIMSMELLTENVMPWVVCSNCGRQGTLIPSMQDEVNRGMASIIWFYCRGCKMLVSPLPTSHDAARKHKRGPAMADLNLRAAIANIHCGIGLTHLERFCGILNLPAPAFGTYDAAEQRVHSAMLEVGAESMLRWRNAERIAALSVTDPVTDASGRVGIDVSSDTQWLKPGRAHNAPDGYTPAIGCRTRKIIDADYRTKHGDLQNHQGSSGSMEPLAIADMVVRLGSMASGVFVKNLCMDLDAKTPAKCAEVCQAKGVVNPKVQHDPNHYVKTAKGKFIEAKSAVKVTNCFPPETQLRLAQEFAMALHQNRGTDLPTLRGALLNVLQHAYNDHTNCAKYFNCPCAPGQSTPRTTSKYKGCEWLSEAGQAGAGGPAKLRKILDEKFAKLTTDVHLIALLHMNDTQVCEAFNRIACTRPSTRSGRTCRRPSPGRRASTRPSRAVTTASSAP